MNRMELIGNVGADPEMSYTSAGKAVCKMRVAVNERRGTGENRTESTMWLTCVAWERLAEVCGEYLRKGSRVYVAGRLQVREFTRNDGTKGTAVEVVLSDMEMLGGKPQEAQKGATLATPADDSLPF